MALVKRKVLGSIPSTPRQEKKQRICSICNKPGHNKATCRVELNPDIQIDNTPVSKEAALGHQLLAEQNKIVEREKINGLIPEKGLWIISHKRRKIAGKIIQVKRTGEVVWKSSLGTTVITPQSWFKDEEYVYTQDLEPEMLRWYVI